MGYGHDDRICAYPSYQAMLSLDLSLIHISISDIKVTAEKDTLELGEEMQVSVKTEAEGVDADMAAYTLSSSNDQVLTVDETGKVTAVGSGKAEIIATANFSTVKSSVEVTVAGEVVLDKPCLLYTSRCV